MNASALHQAILNDIIQCNPRFFGRPKNHKSSGHRFNLLLRHHGCVGDGISEGSDQGTTYILIHI